MDKKLKIGVAGIGHLGKIHIENLKEKSIIDLVGIYDINPKKSKTAASEYSVRSFNSLDDMIKESDAVSIVVPTSVHFEVAEAVLNSNKHVFIEKPITSKLEDAEKLVSTLLQTKAQHEQLLKICNELARLGCPNAGELGKLCQN